MLISFSPAYAVERDALQQQVKLLACDGKACAVVIICRQFIGSFFQSLVIHRKAIAFPQQQFYLVAFFIKEDKHSPIKYIHFELRTNQSAQAVEAFSHICAFCIEVIAARRRQV